MSEPITPATKPEITETGHKRVSCQGPATGRHPKVYLTMVDDAEGRPQNVVCPYCSHVFRYNPALTGTVPAH
jgi:uncharacterized Zn-finger protein